MLSSEYTAIVYRSYHIYARSRLEPKRDTTKLLGSAGIAHDTSYPDSITELATSSIKQGAGLGRTPDAYQPSLEGSCTAKYSLACLTTKGTYLKVPYLTSGLSRSLFFLRPPSPSPHSNQICPTSSFSDSRSSFAGSNAKRHCLIFWFSNSSVFSSLSLLSQPLD